MSAPAASRPTAPTAAPPAERGSTAGFVQGFDGLRAIAALLVVVVHVAGDSGYTYRSSLGEYTARGEIGVSVFFLISGFLLYRPFVAAALGGRPGPGIKSYLVRRALRIVPLYWVALIITYAFTGWASVHGVSGLLENMFFLQIYSTDWVFHGITQAWSLCIEVTFYLALPVWAAMMRRLDRARAAAGSPATPGAVLRRELGALALLYVVSLLFRIWVVADPHGPTATARSWLPAWGDHFALGMGLAVVGAYVRETGVTPRAVRWLAKPGADLVSWVAAGVLFWLVSTQIGLTTAPLYVGHWYNDLGKQVLYGVFGLFMLLPAVFGPPRVGLVRRLLSARVLALTGLVSYGIYLWHQVVIRQLQRWVPSWEVLNTPVVWLLLSTLAVTLLISTASYIWVERPGIAVGHRWLLRRREQAAETGR
jgi:peptidoglycan/LPS O-acetylase OafA/YrhL